MHACSLINVRCVVLTIQRTVCQVDVRVRINAGVRQLL